MLKHSSLFIRACVFTTIMWIVTPIWACVCFIASPLPYTARYYITARWNVFIIWLAKYLCGIEYQIKGAENLPDSPAILLCKHQSAWETIFLFCKMPRPLIFVLKKELLNIPFFGWALRLLRMISIDRKNTKSALKKVISKGQKRLRDGQWIIMFPEGTRTKAGEKGKYKHGGTRLAIATNTVVVPIAVNAGHLWPKGKFIKYPGLITVSIGKPINPDNHTPESMMQEVENWIESEMRALSPELYN